MFAGASSEASLRRLGGLKLEAWQALVCPRQFPSCLSSVLLDQRVFGEVCRRFITIGVVVGGRECVLGI